MSPPYLQPLISTVDLPQEHKDAIAEVERQFDLSSDKLQEILKQMLWEYRTGLKEYATDKNKDTFL